MKILILTKIIQDLGKIFRTHKMTTYPGHFQHTDYWTTHTRTNTHINTHTYIYQRTYTNIQQFDYIMYTQLAVSVNLDIKYTIYKTHETEIV